MPRGDKSKYSDKQERQAEHIEEGYEDRGVSEKEAERRAWATVNKQEGGGRKSGPAESRGRKSSSSSRKGGSKGATSSRRSDKTNPSRRNRATKNSGRKTRTTGSSK